MTFYLVRHAQSLPTRLQYFSEWPLSPAGIRQAEHLVDALTPLAITRVFSSPFVRSVQTAKPFADRHGLRITRIDDVRERLITSIGPPSDEVWTKSWEDFNYCPPGCETSLAAQSRMCLAMAEIARDDEGVTAVFTHGNVMGLFLNAITNDFGRQETEALTNPDVLKIEWCDGVFKWDRKFRLASLERFATTHGQTPREDDTVISSQLPMPPAELKAGIAGHIRSSL